MIGKTPIIQVLKPFLSLYSAVFFFLTALGLLSTFLSLRLTMAGVGVQTTGLVLTVYYLGLTVGTFCCGGMIRQVGHIRAFTAFSAVSTAVVLVHGLYLSVPLWMVLRFTSGVANMGCFMVIESWLNACGDPKARGRIFSIYMIMTYLGGTLGQKVLGMADVESHTLYLVVGIFMVMSIVPVAMTRAIHPELPKREGIRFVAVCKKAPIGMTGSFVSGVLISAFYAMGPVFAHDINLDVSQLSWYMTLSIIGGLIFQWPIGSLSDRFDRTLIIPGIGTVLCLISLFITFAGHDNVEMILGAMVFFGGFLFTIYPVAVARAHDMFEAEDVVKVSSALLVTYGVGAIIGPMAASTVITWTGNPYGLYYYFIGGSAGFVLLSLVWRKLEIAEIVPAEEQSEFFIMKQTSNVAIHMDPRLEPENETAPEAGDDIRPKGQPDKAGEER
ncbi:MAG: MFS transporter [Desulfobacterales bacterium]|nr:MFS transporter [Desulfobacterales bacterium]